MKRLFIILSFISLIFSCEILGQTPSLDTIPKKLGASNWGKEFWFSIPPCFEDESSGFANFIKIFVTSPIKTLVTVEIPGNGYLKARNTVPNDVIEFYITPVQASPWTKNGQASTPPDAIYKRMGIHVYAEQPLVVYCVVRYHWTSEGFLAIPVSSLGREYIVNTAEVEPIFNDWGYKMPSTVTMTAAYDYTKLRFLLGGNDSTKTTGMMKPGDSTEKTLMKGDVFVVSTEVRKGDLSGSKIISTKPVCVTSGNFCSDIPIGNQWCDYTAEMELPEFTWGQVYHIGKIPNRKYSSMIKIFAKEAGTKIFRNGNLIGTLETNGGILNKGFIFIRMNADSSPGSVVISGDKPIAVSLYNCGVQEEGYPAPNSDPFIMSILPDEQFQKEVFFCTPGIMGGQGFNENYINLVYETDANGLMPDHIEFAGPPKSNVFNWVKCSSLNTKPDELFKQNVKGKKYALKNIALPGDGVYKIRSKTPFASYSFGYSDYDSYGYPAGGYYIDQEHADTIPPEVVFTMHCDGSVSDGVVTDMPEDKTIRSNLSLIIFHSDLSYNYIFNYIDFIPGDTRTTNWTLKTIDPTKDARAVITFADRRGNDTTIILESSATLLAIHPSQADFGKLKTGETKTIDFRVINYSDKDTASINLLKLQNDSIGFSLKLPATFPLILNPKDSVMFSVTFTGTKEGKFVDSVGVGDHCYFFNACRVQASVGNPIIFVDDLSFNSLMVGKSATSDFHITNEGNIPIMITGYIGPNNSIFTSTLPLIDNYNPLVLSAKDERTFQITCKPVYQGEFSDSIFFISDAGTNRKNYCKITGSATITEVTSTNSEREPLKIINIYPAPSGGKFTITTNLDETISVDVKISDLGGRLISSFIAELSRETSFDLSKLLEGVYIMSIKAGNETVNRKFTIKK